MTGHFPTPLPDELLYSVCARFSDRVDYPGKYAIHTELFGIGGSASIVLPSRLNYLASNLPFIGENCPQQFVDRLIKNHTLFPLYRPFLPAERVQQIREAMGGSNGSIIHIKAGITSSSLNLPDWLRFCAVCIDNDRQQFGYAYWHRLHQVPGVEVCPLHKVFLSNSSARSRNRVNHSLYVSAESVAQPTVLRPLCSHEPDHQSLLQLASDAAWLLENGSSVSGFSSLHNRYQLLLADNGFVRKDGNASLKHLVPAIRSKYSKGLLEVVQCGLDENKHFNWPFLLLPHITHGNTDPPIRHLLFFQLLGSSAEAFFCRPLKQTRSKKTSKVANRQNQKPFGTGPWSCLNPVCKEYRKLEIKTCTIGPYYRKPWRFMATFACTCGFTYRRIGPDNSPEMCYRFIVQQRGTVWESYLQNAWADSSMNGKAIALKLNISWSNLKSIAIRMGLPFPRHAATQSGSYILTSKIKPPPPKSKPSFNDYRTMHRKRWLTARKQHPSANRRQLHHELAPGPLYWLSKYDKKWLLDHSPPPVMGIGSAPRIDWNKRDVRLAAAVHASALRVRKASSPSIRITTAAITREVGELRSLRSKESRDKLPLAAKALREVLEGPIDFVIRKIERAANELLQEGTRPGLYPLRTRAAIHSSLWYVPEISAAFDKALQSLVDADSESQAVEAA